MPGSGELPMLLPIGGRSLAVIKMGEMIMIVGLDTPINLSVFG